MSKVILCDFDRTITEIDLPIALLEKYVEENYEIYDELLLAGEITLEECIVRQFTMLKVPKQQQLQYIDSINPVIRDGFPEFVDYCKRNNIILKIISASLDYVIEHILQQLGIKIKLVAFKTDFSNIENGLNVTPPALEVAAADFKQAMVFQEQQQGNEVIYIGDGISDLHAAKVADVVFAVEEELLAKTLAEQCISFKNFNEILLYLQKYYD